MTPADTDTGPATETGATLPLGPVPRPGARAFLALTRVDLGLVVGLVVLAFLARSATTRSPRSPASPSR